MNLTKIIKAAPEYVILRMSPEFPWIKRGQDIDLLVKSIPEWTDFLSDYMRQFPGKIVTYGLDETHWQIDYYEQGFLFKWDLYSHYISDKYVHDTFKTAHVDPMGFIVPAIKMNRISKCFELLKYGKHKYFEFEQYRDDLKEYEI